jgi:2-polyprenyl-6-methoxyphenol hydroxylase-like FAD-dependent oxidoreductase
MGDHAGTQAVVLGGSMAGLLSARVLSEHYDHVLLVDRDELTGVRSTRRGAPHGGHAHGLIARGQQILQQQFPGLTEELEAAGVRPGDFGDDISWYFNGRRLATTHTGLISVPATRPVLEYHVRRRVQGIPNVRFLERHDILGLLSTDDRSTITGVRVRGQGDGDAEQELRADLVVDTTGRGSRTPAWLSELGYARPEEERVKIGLAYTTRHFRLTEDPFGDEIAIIPVATPSHPRGAFFYRLPGVDGGVELTLTGILGDHPPTDPEGFLEFTRSLPTPQIYEAVKDAEPLDDAVTHRFPASVRRRYDHLTRFPAHLLVLGDAACSFNPVYGQGMTVAALESLTLARHVANRNPDALAFFRDISAVIDAPWDFAAVADLGYPGVEGKRTAQVRFVNAYVARMQRAAARDATLTNAFIRVAGLIEQPPSLMKPNLMARVLRFGGKSPAGPTPSEVAAKPAAPRSPAPKAGPATPGPTTPNPATPGPTTTGHTTPSHTASGPAVPSPAATTPTVPVSKTQRSKDASLPN